MVGALASCSAVLRGAACTCCREKILLIVGSLSPAIAPPRAERGLVAAAVDPQDTWSPEDVATFEQVPPTAAAAMALLCCPPPSLQGSVHQYDSSGYPELTRELRYRSDALQGLAALDEGVADRGGKLHQLLPHKAQVRQTCTNVILGRRARGSREARQD